MQDEAAIKMQPASEPKLFADLPKDCSTRIRATRARRTRFRLKSNLVEPSRLSGFTRTRRCGSTASREFLWGGVNPSPNAHSIRVHMKTSYKLMAVLALGGTGILTLTSGCAATGTRQSTGQYIDDAAVTAKVKTALIRDEIVKAMQVEVETYEGTVQLSGFVDSLAQKERAEQVASTIAGVTAVRNNIVVKQAAE